jgi:flagellin-like protein
MSSTIHVNPKKGGIKKKMKTFRRSKKALSPVVASIILIAVTVAVSIAVAAWMGALSVGFMATEQVSLINPSYPTADTIRIAVRNSGSSSVTINSATVNNVAVTMNSTLTTFTVQGNAQDIIDLGQTWQPGYTYTIKLTSTKGNIFTYTAVAS